MAEIEDSVVIRRVPGTEIRPGDRVFTTRSMGVVVMRPATPAELMIIQRHPECLEPDRMSPTPTPTMGRRLSLA